MRVVIVILGLLLGALVGTGLLLANPLAFLGGLPPLPSGVAPAKAYHWENYRGIEGGIADLLGIARRERSVALMDPALPHLRIGTVVLPAGEGRPAALAVKVSAIAEDNSLWRARLGTLDYWNVLWPGEGSVFAAGYSNFWPLVRDSFWAALRGGGTGLLAPEYPVSAPPPADFAAGVIGASGRYAGFTGEIREVLYPADDGPDWTLAVKVVPPPVARR